ncbi:putative large, multifunctional secreted protein [Lunatimonas lonarensis]|uniref:Putative large, multifunctional secreted protein n=1 Tax=Lunatimonas lonarensis TaxID=1232681 RepID=R7ZXN7_9BACT|nr:c-type cytochrome [Lunatimonas lonarensis]EON78921.1 putative large, multifunctional secreted protein [Lunatimonas lonarensis]
MTPFRIPFCFFLFFVTVASGCGGQREADGKIVDAPVKDYIRAIPGEDEDVPEEIIHRGEVLVAYTNCYECHRRDSRAKGPAFADIAKRYPRRQVYIDLLARKIISGGTGSWGYPVMLPHPQVSFEDAQAMATYVLSTDKH